MTKTIEIVKDNEKVNDNLKKGLWKTGENKYVEIANIDDLDYLIKLLHTLHGRDQRAYDLFGQVIAKLDVNAHFYIHILNRIAVLKKQGKLTKNIKLLSQPIADTVCDPDLKVLRGKIDEILLSLNV